MICDNCKAKFGYGYKYCTECGNKVNENLLEESYNETVWGKLDGFIKKYEGFTLKKITNNRIFKIVVLLLTVLLTYFGFFGNEYQLHIAESGAYAVQYDVESEEYYVLSDADAFTVSIHIPKYCDYVQFTGYAGGDKESLKMKPEECHIEITKGKYDYMTVEAMKGEKAVQSLKFSAPIQK